MTQSRDMASRPTIGIIGGTGLYEMEWLENAQWVKAASAFGEPSDDLLVGEYLGQRLVFLPRHGRGHRFLPSHVNYRANIEVLKRAGVTQVIAFSAVGSMREELTPGTFVVVDQYIDRTYAREKSFFGDGFAAHVSMADPVCGRMGGALTAAAARSGVRAVRGGTYVVMEGPQFSTRAESRLYRSWGCDVIGMTNMPEANLAREAELCYATVAMVTDYDCWHPHHEDVTTAGILKVLAENVSRARELIKATVPLLGAQSGPCGSKCDRALTHAVATARGARSPEAVKRLSVVAGRILSEGQ